LSEDDEKERISCDIEDAISFPDAQVKLLDDYGH
jgi:hypothetical protein